jgi:hypothetical protein
MPDSPFDSAWLKWARGVVNANALAGQVNALASQPHYRLPLLVRHEYNAKCHCIIVSVVEVENPFPDSWALLLGDVVQNFRSALDHIAWALYKRGRTPNVGEKRERRVYFPIYADRLKFNAALTSNLPGVRRTDRAKVRSCQPYLVGKRNLERHALLVVDELSRLDKHRVIQLVEPVPDRAAFHIGKQTDCIYRRMSVRPPRGILQPGAELTRIYVKRTGPDPYVDVNPRFTIDPAIKARLTLEEFLKTTMRAVSFALFKFAEPPPSVQEITGSPVPRP